MHAHTHMHTYTYTHAHKHTHTNVCTNSCTHTCMHVYLCILTNIGIGTGGRGGVEGPWLPQILKYLHRNQIFAIQINPVKPPQTSVPSYIHSCSQTYTCLHACLPTQLRITVHNKHFKNINFQTFSFAIIS